MPLETAILDPQPSPLPLCPRCLACPFIPFMRGQVQRSPMPWWAPWPLKRWRRAYCAIICRDCKEIVGWETPSDQAIEAYRSSTSIDWRARALAAEARLAESTLKRPTGCRCTHEAGDSRCDVHPTCDGCGDPLDPDRPLAAGARYCSPLCQREGGS